MKNCKLFSILKLATVLLVVSITSVSCMAQGTSGQLPESNGNLNSSVEYSGVSTINNSANRTPVTSRNVEEFPYIAIVTGDDVYVRSGPGAPYYPVCKVHKGQEVIVTMESPGKTSWSRVEPVPGSVAYISSDFVQILEGASSVDVLGKEVLTGVVTGNDVNIRAGSVDMAPENAYRVLMKAEKGQQLSIVGKLNGFYKIVPPRGSYFWVASDYLARKQSVSRTEVVSLRDQTEQKLLEKAVSPGELQSQYITLKDILNKYDLVQSKSLMERDYGALRAEVQQLAQNTDSPAVKSTVEVILKNIVAGENAQKQVNASIEQDSKIEEAMLKIDQAVVQALKEMSPVSASPDIVVIKGKLDKSAVFTSGASKRYILIDESGLIVCYVSGDGLEQYIGKSVSISGPVSYDPFGKTRVVEAIKVVEVSSVND